MEILRLTDEVDALNLRLLEEENRRREAEMAWKAAEEKAEMVEEEVRAECWDEMEMRLQEEQRRWKSAWLEEVELSLSLPSLGFWRLDSLLNRARLNTTTNISISNSAS